MRSILPFGGIFGGIGGRQGIGGTGLNGANVTWTVFDIELFE